jgi:hypothetical protein
MQQAVELLRVARKPAGDPAGSEQRDQEADDAPDRGADAERARSGGVVPGRRRIDGRETDG